VDRDAASQFALRPGLVMLNHASFGLATTALLDRADQIRRAIESDPVARLTDELTERLAGALGEVCSWLGLDPTRAALTTNATAGAAAVTRSLPLAPGDAVVILSSEYPSILRGWQQRCLEAGADLHVVDVALPVPSVDALLVQLEALPCDRVAVLQFSAISSATAVQLPVAPLVAWGHGRGARVIVDGAHGPGHVPVDGWDGDAAFATLHKWLPAPRSSGVVWTSGELAASIRPGEVSLTWDSANLGERFAWPGTFDPAPRLVLPDAIATWREWLDTGALARAAALADDFGDALTAAGTVPTAGPGLRPPQLRSFLLEGVTAERLKAALAEAGIVAPAIPHSDTASLLRVATHVYNDYDDVDALTSVVRRLRA
jgi:isopenicillin-N epimerase